MKVKMTIRTKLIALIVLLSVSISIWAEPNISNIKFGILSIAPDGTCSLVKETTRIPRYLKDTGFRFGIAFDNTNGDNIEWFEVIRLPSTLKEVSGVLRRGGSSLLQTDTKNSNYPHVVDDFWFDEGDPLGTHVIELYVNGKKIFSGQFEVIDP